MNQKAKTSDIQAGPLRGRSFAPDTPPAAGPGLYRPFPVDLLPEPLRGLVVQGADSIGCDPALIAMPLLAGASAAIGNSRRVRIKPDWTEPATLWTVVVQSSGTMKTPAQRLALGWFRKRQAAFWQIHKQALAEHREAKKQWREKPAAERGAEPPEPEPAAHLYCTDTTVEALAVRLEQSPRGLLVAWDELAGLFKSFGQYKGGGGGDREAYLSFYDASSAKIDRKGAQPPTLFIPRAYIALTGGVQPGVLRELLASDMFASGFSARLLFAMPGEQQITWRDRSVTDEVVRSVENVFDRLLMQQMVQGEYEAEPMDVRLSDAARAVMIDWVNQNGRELAAMDDDRLKWAWSKLRGAAPRLALVLHCASVAAGVLGVDETMIDEKSMRAGVELAMWFGAECRRVYQMLSASAVELDLVPLIRGNGGSISVRELMRRRSKYSKNCRLAEQDLQALVEKELGRWQYSPISAEGGRQKVRFILLDNNATPAPDSASGGCVNVNDVDATPDDYEQIERQAIQEAA